MQIENAVPSRVERPPRTSRVADAASIVRAFLADVVKCEMRHGTGSVAFTRETRIVLAGRTADVQAGETIVCRHCGGDTVDPDYAIWYCAEADCRPGHPDRGREP